MKEIKSDIWKVKADWICVTTNGKIRADGRAVMGAGIAKDAKIRFPDIDSYSN